MRVTVSARSKFWLFHTAEQLQKRGHLLKLLTAYYDPQRNGRGYDIDLSLVETHLPSAVLTYGPRFVPVLRNWSLWKRLAREIYDRWAARNLPESHILVALSGGALHSLRAARELGIVTIVERGSTHIVRQREILSEEYQKLGIDGELPSDYVIGREVREYAEADYIAIPSTFVRQSFLDQGVSEEKLLQIPFGVDLSHFRPAPKEDDTFRVMHIGCRIRKGTHYLIQAMSELELGDSELLLIGSPNGLIQTLLEDYDGKCRVLGPVPHLELYRIYSQSSVYVLPSIEEGLAQVQLEAMACGVPVICSTNTGGEDSIRDGIDGFVVPVRDVEALKEKILYLYEHEEERRAMGRSALKRAREFTWDRYGERVVETYRNLLAKSEGDVS